MVFQRNKLAAAVGCLLGIGGILLPLAAPAQTPDIRVDVTGSNIKRVEGEGALPVEIVTREEIQRTGARTVNELLRYIPSVDIYDQGEIASNSPSGSGTTTIRMRGLAETNVLVLLNGRRLPVNALYDASGAGAAVDVNMIPISAIERVEILKDGGSAIYGADAVAGVVNFITRKDFQGVEATGRWGISQEGDGEEWGGSLTAGFGNYEKDGYNVLFTIDYLKRDPIYRKDREISKSVDFRRIDSGAPDGRSSFAPQGNYVNPDTGAFVGGSVRPCPPELIGGNPARCRFDFNQSILTLYNGADRTAAMLVGNFKINNDLKAFANLTYSHAEDHFEAQPVPDFFVVPSGTGLIAGRFMQGGPRITDRKSDLYDISAGLEGTTKWFDWDFAIGHGESHVKNSDRNYYDANKWADATGNGLIDPTVTTNDPAFVESLKVSPVRDGRSKLDSADLRARGQTSFTLPAGNIGWAVGTSWWKESLRDTPDPLTQAGDVVGSIQQSAVDASRNAYAVYGEVNVPIVKTLELQGALRYDHYSNASKTSPKIGLYWTPIKQLAFRASYTESFRVPSLKQLYGAQEQGAGDITEDQDCVLIGQEPGCEVAYFQVSGSNPNLKPEKGKTYNLGVVTDVGPFSATLDWWRIDVDDAITQPTTTSALQQGLFTHDANGRLLVFTNLQNVAQAKNEGIDLDARLRFPGTIVGNVTIRDAATYYITQSTREAGGEWADFNGTYALPRWRNVFSVSTEWQAWEASLFIRTVDGFIDTPNPWTASDPGLIEGVRKVGTNDQWDISAAYTGFKNWRLSGGIVNLWDKTPPYSRTNAVNNQYEQVGFAPLYTARGRFFHVEATYTFK